MSLVSEPIFLVQNQNNYVMYSNKQLQKYKLSKHQNLQALLARGHLHESGSAHEYLNDKF